jgi:hypothetical protein
MQLSRTLSIAIARPPDVVCAFVTNPENLPRWSFLQSVARDGDRWRAVTPDGAVSIRFVEPNPYGVLDHYVRVSAELEVYAPMRVIRNGGGSEVLFTAFRRDGMTDEAFERDTDTVARDLSKLKAVLEAT